MPSDAQQISNLEEEVGALSSPTTSEVRALSRDYDADIVAASALRQAMEGGGGGGGGSQIILLGSTSVTSNQLKNLTTSSVEILPAPGGRNYYVIHGFVFHLRFVTTPYNERVQFDLIIGYGSDAATLQGDGGVWQPFAISPAVGDLFKATEDTYVGVPITSTGAALGGTYIFTAGNYEDEALSMASGYFGGSDLTGGDSTLTIRTFYSVIDGAP